MGSWLDTATAIARHLAARSGAGGAETPERPVLIVNGSPQGASPALLKALAGECGRVLAVDSGLCWLADAGIGPDAIVGDMDSVDPSVLAGFESRGIPLERHVPEKDETDLELALGYARSHGWGSCVAANVFGGRLDHMLASIGALAACGLPAAAVDDDRAMVFLPGGEAVPLAELGLVPGSEYSVMALDGPAVVSQAGVAYPQESAMLPCLSGLGVSNIVRAPDARVTVEAGRCALVIERGRA